MMGRLKALAARIDALSLRERALVFAALLGAFGWAWNELLFAPLDARRVELAGRVPELREEIARLHAQATELAELRSRDPDAANRRRLAALRAEAAKVDSELARLTDRLVPPEQMTRVIEAVLTRQRGLRLVRLEGLGAEPIGALPAAGRKAADARPGGGGPAAGGAALLYRHGLRVVFEGGYLDTLAYLEALEGLPWRFLWEEMSLEVEEYPLARVAVTVRSLSLDEAWIGV